MPQIGCNRIALLVSLSSVMAVALPAWAQNGTSTPATSTPADAGAADDAIPDIVVTAQKRAQSINDVGMSINAVSGEDLLQRGITNVSDLGKVVPGFVFTPTQSNSPVYTIRGIGFYETTLVAAPTVSVYTDEIPLPFPAMTKAAGLDLERVEVLKGPQGTLFGQNSTGGAINYVTAKPTSDLAAGIDWSYDRFSTADLQSFISGPIATNLKARLAVRVINGGDWQKSFTRDDQNGKTDQLQGRLLLDWQPTDRLKLFFNVNGWRDRSDTQAGQLLAIIPQVPANLLPIVANYPLAPKNNRAADWTPSFTDGDERFYQTALRAEYDLADKITLTSITSYSSYKTNSSVDSDAISVNNIDERLDGYVKSFNQELRISGETSRMNWIIGGTYDHHRAFDRHDHYVGDASNSFVFPGLPFARAASFSRQKVTNYAVFGNIEFRILENVTLQAGARYTKSKRTFFGCTEPAGDANYAQTFELLQTVLTGSPDFVPIGLHDCISFDANIVPGSVTDSLKEDNLSWRAGVNWDVGQNSLLYVNISKGYKAGSFPTLPAAAQSQYAPVTQESLTAYEAGFKLSLIDRHLQLNGAGFYYAYKNKQLRGTILDLVFGTLEALVNIPKSRVVGAELSIAATPFTGLDLNISGSYTDTKIQRFIGLDDFGQPADFAGSRFPYTPKLQVTSDGQYTWHRDSGVSPFIGASVTYVGATNSTFGYPALETIGKYTLVDARAGVESESGEWRVTGWVRNLFNKYYWLNVVKHSDTAFRYTGRPVTYGLSVSKRF